MGMSFLQGIGGVGAGLMSAQQILQKQKESEQRAKTQDLQNQQAQMAIDAEKTKAEDASVMRSESQRLMQQANGTDADTINAGLNREAGFSDGDMKEIGVKTSANPDGRFGLAQVQRGLADTALARGNIDLADKHMKFSKMMDDEGFNRAIQMADSGASMEDITKEVNKFGVTRLAPGQLKGYDRESRTLSMIGPDGKEASVNINALERSMLDLGSRVKLGQDDKRLDIEGKKLDQNEKRIANQLTLQEMRDTAKAISDDKRFNAMMQAAEVRSRRGELGGKPPTQVATAEWLLANGVAKTKEEAWQKANQLGEAVNEKVTTDSYGNTTVHNPQTGEIVRMDGEGKKTVIRAAIKGIDKAPSSIPKGLVIGAPTKQADGQYSAGGKTVTIKSGKIVEIK